MMNNQAHIPQEVFEEIERFLLQKMKPEEEEKFRERLLLDPDLDKTTEEMKLLSIGIQESLLEQKLNSFHEELPAQNLTKKNGGKIISIKAWLAAASVFIVIAVSAYFIFLGKNKKDALFAQYFQPDAGLMTAMGPASDYQFNRGMVDYKNSNYPAAIKTWEGLLNAKPNNDTLNYFLGSAYLADKKTEKAIEYFERVIAYPGTTFRKDAYWYLGLSYLKQGKKNQAIEYIQKSGHPQHKEILKTINKK